MALLSGWPGDTDVEDDGSGQIGTVWNKTWKDAERASIEDQVHSATNPTIKPKTTTDLVKTAGGSCTDLPTRLDVALNADGTPKAVAGQASEAQVSAIIGHGNWVQNDNFLIWAKGDAVAPTSWVLDTITAARAGTGLGDTTTKCGPYCVKLTRAAVDGSLSQFLMNTTSFGVSGACFQGRTFGFGCWIKTSVSTQARLRLYDGVTSSYTDYHVGDGTWKWYSGTHTLSGSATQIKVFADMLNSSGDAYFSGVTVVPGTLPPSDWVPCPMVTGTIKWQKVGSVAVVADIDRFDHWRPLIVRDVRLIAKTAPLTTAIKVDVNVYDGAAWQSMFTTKPEIAASAYRSVLAKPDGTYAYRCLAPGFGTTFDDTEMNWDIDQIGTGTV
ncbi:MAG TPA: hypothetical protein VMZ92_17435, partial [Planctomycetota bacterium]|nr:hypothetical protein [Planctomycetota bacterium]